MPPYRILVLAAELIGTAAFSVSGVMTAAGHRLDIFGALVLGCVTSVGGGVLRDLLLGITPPMLFRDPIYFIVAAIVSLLFFLIEYFFGEKLNRQEKRFELILNLCDSLGLSVFVLIGVNSALNAGFADNLFLTVFVGTITGVGGGILRDMMAGQVPVILKRRIYAVAAIFGALFYYLLFILSVPQLIAFPISAILIFLIRILAICFRWNLPRYPKH